MFHQLSEAPAEGARERVAAMPIQSLLTGSAPIAIFIALQMLDVATTLFGFRLGLGEGSPVLGPFIRALGPVPGLLAGKIATCFVLGAYFYFRTNPKYWFVNFLFVLVVGWNLALIASRLGGFI